VGLYTNVLIFRGFSAPSGCYRRRVVPVTQINSIGFAPYGVPGDWRASVNVGALSAESRRALLEAVRGKLGWSGALTALGISGAALSRYLQG